MEQLFWTIMWKLHAEDGSAKNRRSLGSLALWNHYDQPYYPHRAFTWDRQNSTLFTPFSLWVFNHSQLNPNPKWHSYAGKMKGWMRDYNRNCWFWQEEGVSEIGPLRKLTFKLQPIWCLARRAPGEGRGGGKALQPSSFKDENLNCNRNKQQTLGCKTASIVTMNEFEWEQSAKAAKCIGSTIRISTMTSKRPHMHVKNERGGVQNENESC